MSVKNSFLIVLLYALISNSYAERKNPFIINIRDINDWSTESVFKDEFLMSREWIAQHPDSSWGKGAPLKVDKNGWVTELKDRNYAEAMMFTNGNRNRDGGKYICLYEGKGKLNFWNSKILKEEPGRIEVELPKGIGISVQVRETDPDDYVKNIRFVLPEHEKNFQKEPFHEKFVNRWGKYYAIRFMEVQKTNAQQEVSWESRTTKVSSTQTRRQGGMSVEYMVEMANTLNSDGWFCIPHQADDKYIRKFAEYVRDNLKPELRAYFEYSNEVWNNVFACSKWCEQKGLDMGLSQNAFQARLFFYAKRSVQMFDIVEDVFKNKERVVKVLSSQSENPWTAEQILKFEDAYKRADALAIAPYFGGRLGSPDSQNDIANWSVDKVLDSLEREVKYEQSDRIKDNFELLKNKFSDRKLDLITYEGGQHLVGYAGAENNKKLEELFTAVNRHPRMKDIYYSYLSHWKKSGGKAFALFSSMEKPNKWGMWGLLEDEYQDTTKAPKYMAAREFAKKNPVWWSSSVKNVKKNKGLAEVKDFKIVHNKNDLVIHLINDYRGAVVVELTNILGRKVLSKSFKSGKSKTLSIPHDVSKSLYLLKISMGEKQFVEKILF